MFDVIQLCFAMHAMVLSRHTSMYILDIFVHKTNLVKEMIDDTWFQMGHKLYSRVCVRVCV